MVDYDAYKRNYLVQPAPQPRYEFSGTFNITLFYEAYAEAVAYYTQVFGPPAYVEDADTRGWRIGQGWLTLLHGKDGNPRNVEVMFLMPTPAEAEKLQAALIAAGGSGEQPSDQLMYDPVRYCPVRDPFGVDILVYAQIEHDAG